MHNGNLLQTLKCSPTVEIMVKLEKLFILLYAFIICVLYAKRSEDKYLFCNRDFKYIW